jgi:hypothetical protein
MPPSRRRDVRVANHIRKSLAMVHVARKVSPAGAAEFFGRSLLVLRKLGLWRRWRGFVPAFFSSAICGHFSRKLQGDFQVTFSLSDANGIIVISSAMTWLFFIPSSSASAYRPRSGDDVGAALGLA